MAQIMIRGCPVHPAFIILRHQPMTTSFATTPPLATSIPSVQLIADGIPRFQIPACPDDPNWEAAAALEANGGVSAEIRAFLDAQLETGDVLLDLAPGFGFVALSATTAAGGLPTVFVGGLSESRLQTLQDAAVDVGGWLESIDTDAGTDLAELLDTRLDSEGRVFVHVATADVADICTRLQPLIAEGRVLAICLPDAHVADDWTTANRALNAAGMTACALVEQDGEAVMVRVAGTPSSPVIALPSALADDAPTAQIESVDAEVNIDLVDNLFPAPSVGTTPSYASASVGGALVANALVANALVANAPAPVAPRWNALRDGLSFISSHSRTGYGVSGAHLLRAMQQRGVPVAFFPLGAVDRTLAENPQLHQAVNLQDAYRPDVPSVRLSQQFDLAMHVGRGAHVAYTIFELDTFTPRELHHLATQDAIFVCSEWARQLCLDNGLTETPLHIVPLGVDRAIFNENVEAKRRWSNETVFMQVGKLEPRKGQLDMLRAFEDAFTPKDNVRLVLSCGNPFVSTADLDAMLRPFKKSPLAARITLLTAELPAQADVAELMAAADCGVFAARAEGWNLEALEMLSMGKSVIATDYSAHTEFMNESNARLIAIDSTEVAFPGKHPGRWASWGTRQHDQLVTQLREVHAQKLQGTLALNAAGIATAQNFSWDASADALIRSLYAIA